MPILIQTTASKVVAISGKASIRQSNGKMRPLKVGDVVVKGDLILTEQDGVVELALPTPAEVAAAVAARPAPAKPPVAVAKPAATPPVAEVAKAVAAVERGEKGAAPGAGPATPGDSELQPGLRVDRIHEATTPAGLRTTGYELQRIAALHNQGNEAGELPGLRVNDVQANEAGGFVTFTVTLDGRYPAPVSVSYAVLGDTATSVADFSALTGSLVFAPGVSSLTVRVPVVNDNVFEGAERFIINLSNPVNATVADGVGVGTIADDDSAPRVVSVVPGAGGESVAEGGNAVVTVSLGNPSSTPTTLPFSLGSSNGAGAADIGTPVFSNGVTLNPDGTLNVPAGVTQFTVSVPTRNDALDETDEPLTINVGGTTGTVTVVDGDAPPALSVADVRVNESAGTLSFTVTLSAASGKAVSVGYATAAGTALEAADYQAIAGTLNFAPGVVQQVVTVALTNDLVHELTETFELRLSEPVNATLARAAGVATVDDDDAAPTIASVQGGPGVPDAVATEGEPLVWTVNLSGPSAVPLSYAFSLSNGTAGAADVGLPQFSDGVVLNANGTLTVPAGVTRFTVSLPTIQDTVDEPNETLSLSVGGVAAQGLITDDDAVPSVERIEAAGAVATEGQPLEFTVVLSNTSSVETRQPFSLGGSASAADLGAISFSNGVVLLPDGSLLIPAGVERFTVHVATVQDNLIEPDESVLLTVGGVTAQGAIVDDDGGNPEVASITLGQAVVNEGEALVFSVTLNNPAAFASTHAFSLAQGTASAADLGTPQFSDGVSLNPDGTLNVPAGVSRFTVTVPTVQDTLVEPDESVLLTVGGVTAQGAIVDDDGGNVEVADITVASASVDEGAALAFSVSLSAAATQATVHAFSLVGGTAGSGDHGAPQFSDGVTLNPDGTLTVPAGVSRFTVTVPTTQDNIDEPEETLLLTVGGASATGTIVDDDAAPTVTSVQAQAVVTEGQPLVFAVSLSNPSSTAMDLPFDLGGTASAADLGQLRFSNGVTLNPDGTLKVPAGVTSFTVTVPTVDDNLDEPDETVVLTVGGVSGQGGIVDGDASTAVRSVSSPTATEGAELAYEVQLNNPSATATVFPFSLGGTADVGEPSFSNGVTLNADGTLTVPAGVSSFTVTVPTVQDNIDEPDEAVPLTIGGVTGTGSIVDDDAAPSVTSVQAQATVAEGQPLVFAVGLSNPSSTPISLPFNLGGTASAADLGQLQFSDGVTLNPDGTLNVPAGVTSFTVTVPTVDDNLDEPDETVVLTVGGVAATGTVADNDEPVNTAPVAQADVASGPEDQPLSGNVLANDSDADGDALRITAFSIAGQAGSFAPGQTAVLAGVGSLTLREDGSWSFAPEANFNGAVPQLSYTVADGRGGSASSTLNINLTPVNDAPVARDDAASTGFNQAVRINVLANDSDVDGGALTVVSAELLNPAQGSVAVNADGSLSFTPAPNVSGSISLRYTVRDAAGATSTANVLVSVAPNTLPEGTDAVRNLAEDGAYTLRVADFGFRDADAGHTLAAVRIDTLPAAGTLRLNGADVAAGQVVSVADIDAGRLVFTPAANGNGSPYASLRFSVQDTAGGLDATPNTLVFNVAPVNDAPVARSDSGSGAFGQVLTGNVLANDSDVDGDVLRVASFQVAGLPGAFAPGGTATIPGVGSLVITADGNYRFTPVAGFGGAVPVVTVNVSDGAGGSASSTLSLSVSAEAGNRSPLAVADLGLTDEDTALQADAANGVLQSLSGRDTDPDGDALRVLGVAFGGQLGRVGEALAGAHGSLLLNADGSYRYVPGAAAQALDTGEQAVDVFTYTITDGRGGTASTTLSITITGTNDAPTTVADVGSTREDTPLNGNVLANDSDVDVEPLVVSSFQVAGLPGSFAPGSTATLAGVGSIRINADGSYLFTPAPNYHGEVPRITYFASDGTTATPGTLSLSVTAVNDAPTALDDVRSLAEDTVATGNVLANDSDADGDALALTLFRVSGISGAFAAGSTAAIAGVGSLRIAADGSYTFTPLPNYNGSVPTVTYTVSDGRGGVSTARLLLTVTPVDDTPVVSVSSASLSEEGLAGANADATGNPDTTNARTASGSIAITDIDSTSFSVTLVAPTAALSSDGRPLLWSGSGTNQLIAYAGAVPVLQVNINNAGAYTVSLLQHIDHAVVGVEDSGRFDISVRVASSATAVGVGSLRVNIEDDSPMFVQPIGEMQLGLQVGGNAAASLGLALGADNGPASLGQLSGLLVDAQGRILATHRAEDGSTVSTLLTHQGQSMVWRAGPTPGSLEAVAQNGTVVLRLSADPVAGTVQATLLAELDASSYTATRFGDLAAGVGGVYELNDAAAAFRIVVSGSVDSVPNTVSYGGGYFGVAGGSLDASERLALNFGTDMSAVRLRLDGFEAGESLLYRVYALDGRMLAEATVAGTGAANQVLALQAATLGGQFGRIELAPLAGSSLRVGLDSITGEAQQLAQSTQLRLAVTDSDGDPAALSPVINLSLNGQTPLLRPDVATTQEDVVLNGNVLANDAAGLAVLNYSIQGLSGSFVPGQVANIAAVGSFVLRADGSYTFNPALDWSGRVPTVVYTAGNGIASASTTLAINVLPELAPPTVGSATASVSEEGLPGGITDATGNPVDSTDAANASGQVGISGKATAVALLAPSQALSSGGVAVQWLGSGTAQLTAMAGTQTVATVGIDLQGRYSVNLLKPLDHPHPGSEDRLSLQFGVLASNGSQRSAGSLTVLVEDDMPVLGPVRSTASMLDTNLLIVLDTSSSMGEASGLNGYSRLQAAVQSVKTLLDSYAEGGDVRVRLVTFSTHAQAQSDRWVTVAEARVLLDALQAGGGSNYDEALADAITAFGDAGRLANAQQVAYVLSDARPTYGSGTVLELVPAGTSPGTPATNGTGFDASGADTGIQPAEESQWTAFLNAHAINAFAIGMGAGLGDANALNPVAYDGRAQLNTQALVVRQFADLDAVLAQTVHTGSGDLFAVLGGTSGQGAGADGGYVRSFGLDGIAYSFEPTANGGAGAVSASNGAAVNFDTATKVLQVGSAGGGTFWVDMDSGAYSYRGPANLGPAFEERFSFSVRDGDGDEAASTGTVNVARVQVLTGTAQADALQAGPTAALLQGLAGDDVLVGGAGDDQLYGGAGADVFRWRLGDHGEPGLPGRDLVGDFDPRSRADGGDVLDLRELLQGESATAANLVQYIDIDTASVAGSTVLRISSSGGFAGGAYSAAQEDQRIVLQDINLRSAFGFGAQAPDEQVLAELLNRNKLDVGP